MKRHGFPLVVLVGSFLAVGLLERPRTGIGLVLVLAGLIPCVVLWYRTQRGRESRSMLGRLAEAASVVALLLAGPHAVLAMGSFGYGFGAGMAQVERDKARLPPKPTRPDPFAPTTPVGAILLNLLRGVVLVGFTAELMRRVRRQERRALEARDQALRARLAPHFIFNTLNTLKAQIERDPTAASATTDRLAALFRQVVQVSDQPTIPLRQELSFVEAYLAIERMRLGDRLRVEVNVPESLEDHPVPPLALQVLVENAVKHGVAPMETGGTVCIEGRFADGGLCLTVTDTGRGLQTESGTGTALETLRQRLAHPGDLTLEPTPEGFRAGFRWRQS